MGRHHRADVWRGSLPTVILGIATVALAIGTLVSAGADTSDVSAVEDTTTTTTMTVPPATTPPADPPATTPPADPPATTPRTDPPAPAPPSDARQLPAELAAASTVTPLAAGTAAAKTSTEPLHNTTAEPRTDCPDTTHNWWHFVVTPGGGNFHFVEIRLDLGDGLQAYPFENNGSQDDNVFVQVPVGKQLTDLIIGEADILSDDGSEPNRFNLSHTCVAAPGGLNVTKTVVGTAPLGASFTVAVDCDDDAFDDTLVFDKKGVLTGGGPLPITGIPVGTSCVITETDEGGADSVVIDTSPAVITADTNQLVDVENTFDPPTGGLNVTKSIVGTAPLGASFTVDVDCDDDAFDDTLVFDKKGVLTGGGPLPITGIPVGTSCVITETDEGGADNVDITGSPAIIVADTTDEVDVENTFDPPTGGLNVTKSIVGTAPLGASFTVDVDCDDDAFDDTLVFDKKGVLTGGGPLPITGIPVGTSCVITETDEGGADNVDITGSPAIIVADTTDEVDVENTFDPPTGGLNVTKTVVGTAPLAATFTVDVDCDGETFDRTLVFDKKGVLTGGGPLPITGIPVGTSCAVTETDEGGADNVDITGSPAIIVADTTDEVDVENTFDPPTGGLNVTKTVVGTAPLAATFTVDVDCDGETFDRTLVFDKKGVLTGGGPLPITGIPVGTSCAVTETDDGGADGVSIPGSPATITADTNALVDVENTFDPPTGGVVVTKVIGHGTPESGTEFVVSVDCKVGGVSVDGYPQDTTFTYTGDLGPHTFNGLPPGAVCAATERSPFGGSFQHDNGSPVTIAAGTTLTITVTNDFDPGSIRVRKVIGTGTPANGTQFVVRVDCTISGQSVTGYPKTTVFTYPNDLGPHGFNTMPLGTVCSATEQSPFGGSSSHDNGSSVTIVSEAVIPTITITNNYDPGTTVVPQTPVQVLGASATRGVLPFTGSPSDILVKTALWLLAIGTGLLLVARPRRRKATPG